MEKGRQQILIAGAGPTGLTTGVELARRGFKVEVIDRRDAASALSRAVGILPRSLELLEASGVTGKLLAAGVKLREIRVYQHDRLKLTIPTRGAHPRYDFILALAQDRTEAILSEVLRELGGVIRYGTELTGFQQVGQHVEVTDQHGHQHHCDYLVGADGIRSRVRQILGMNYPGYDLPETWSIADVDAVGWPNNQAFTLCRLSRGRVAVVAPLESARFRVISNTEDALATLPLPMNITNIRRTGQFTIAIRQVPQYRVGHVFLAGDAAHCHSPVGGRGMNLGMADGAELARCLAEDDLEAYHRNRHADGQRTIALSERARKVVTTGNPLTNSLLVGALSVINVLPLLKRRLARTLLQS